MFGTVTTPAGTRKVMLCVDGDRPDEAMIHICDAVPEPFALLCQCEPSESGVNIKPLLLYKCSPTGALHLPRLTDEEVQYVSGISGRLEKHERGLTGQWKSSVDSSGGSLTLSSGVKGCAAAITYCSTWEAFKLWVTSVMKANDAVLFRGHGDNEYELRTTLHRAGRNRLERYCSEELVQFRNHAEAVLDRKFDLQDGEDYGIVLGLAQHHGLPTPLLDWTESPYIAAFFALADALESRKKSGCVRVYALAREWVRETSPNSVVVPQLGPYASSLATVARHNPRLYAQQGRFLVTNVNNLDEYLMGYQMGRNLQLLFAADIPVELAVEGMRDLRFMGLTAATMFPGLDGVCRMLKHQMAWPAPSLPSPGQPADSSAPSD